MKKFFESIPETIAHQRIELWKFWNWALFKSITFRAAYSRFGIQGPEILADRHAAEVDRIGEP